MARARQPLESRELEGLVNELLEAVTDNLDYGLAYWCFLKGGSEDRPFRDLKQAYPVVWERIIEGLEAG
jgi:hypothetical protein